MDTYMQTNPPPRWRACDSRASTLRRSVAFSLRRSSRQASFHTTKSATPDMSTSPCTTTG